MWTLQSMVTMAQVGPQVAQKLGLPQVTYVEEILSLKDNKLTIVVWKEVLKLLKLNCH